MKKINDNPEWRNCVYPNGAPRHQCPDCKQQCGCTIRQATVFVEATVPALSDGEPDLIPLVADCYIPDSSHYCAECGEEFRSWEKLLNHIRERAAWTGPSFLHAAANMNVDGSTTLQLPLKGLAHVGSVRARAAIGSQAGTGGSWTTP